jgi:hypothetical protein
MSGRMLSICGTQRVGSGQIQSTSLTQNGSQATKGIPSSSNSQKISSRNKESHFGCLTIRALGMFEATRQRGPGAEEIKLLASNGDSDEGDRRFRRERAHYSGMIPVSCRRSDAGSLIVEEVIRFVKRDLSGVSGAQRRKMPQARKGVRGKDGTSPPQHTETRSAISAPLGDRLLQ